MGKPVSSFWLWIFLIVTALFGASTSQAATVSSFAGTCQPSTGLPDGADWTNVNALLGDSDSAAASVSLTKPGSTLSDYLQCTDYGFAIPANGTIVSLTVELLTFATVASTVIANNVSSLKPGTSYSNGGFFTTQYGNHPFGPHLFNTSWTPAEINAAGFGFRFRVEYWGGPEGTLSASVDSVKVIIEYTAPAEDVFEDGFEPPL